MHQNNRGIVGQGFGLRCKRITSLVRLCADGESAARGVRKGD